MIIVTCEVRKINEHGSFLLASTTDVPNEDEALSLTLLRVAALTGGALEQEEA